MSGRKTSWQCSCVVSRRDNPGQPQIVWVTWTGTENPLVTGYLKHYSRASSRCQPRPPRIHRSGCFSSRSFLTSSSHRALSTLGSSAFSEAWRAPEVGQFPQRTT